MSASEMGAPALPELINFFKTGGVAVGVVGLGYVGLPLCNAFIKAGVRVIGVDIDPVKIAKLENGESYLKYTDPNLTERLCASDQFKPTTSFSDLKEADAIFICVPTPLGTHREPDLSYVQATSDAIGAILRPGQLIVLESTTYPGTTREIILPALQKAQPNLEHDRDYFVAYSPEREDPGRVSHTTESTPKLVGGLTDIAGDLATHIYERAVAVVHRVSSAEIAEASKILENTFRAVNIALVNEMKILLLSMGVDIFEVVRAASSKPFGYMPFYPGPGLGGHCIPIDPFYLTWKAHEYGIQTKFVELAGEINSSMPEFVISRIIDALNDRERSVRGAKLLLLGLAYKKDVDDVRESPAFEIAERLESMGAVLSFSDPFVMDGERERTRSIAIPRVELNATTLREPDFVILLTDHSDFPYELIRQEARGIIDTRGVYDMNVGKGVYRA